ncbi:histidine kinase [Dyadobacter sp. CY345]|uniref:sensor histidine kinase n=1 Tax=Dyadobacter sp. CY345 TaxID=2909335 RepID=UPI001F48EF2D|nr:ATP-binding protein [Dyadobacter sp. CY345]MCF2447080.1 histidine kinase [Dyadobacter sp. CY345]
MCYNLLNGILGLTILKDLEGQQATILLVLFVIIYALVSHYLYRKRLRRLLAQQLQALKNERQRISSEIHDDIGAGFFAIKLFADMVNRSGRQDDEIKRLCSMINEMSEKIKEIIWSTNFENDNLENLIYYVEFQTMKLFDHSQIKLSVQIPDDIPEKVISSEMRKNVYLIVKEFVHNAIKHAQATQIHLGIVLSDNILLITILDDGKGFDQTQTKKNSMGLSNINSRIDKLNGIVKIDSVSGTKITVSIPLS